MIDEVKRAVYHFVSTNSAKFWPSPVALICQRLAELVGESSMDVMIHAEPQLRRVDALGQLEENDG